MSNSIFDTMFGRKTQPDNGIMGLSKSFSDMKRMLNGNPETIAKQMVSSGQMTQQQFQEYGNMATQILRQYPNLFK